MENGRMETINVLKVETGKVPERIDLPNTLEAMQQLVGGYIESVWLGDGVCLICNEEGKLSNLEPNRRVGNDIIAGTFFLAGDDESGDFVSLNEKQFEFYEKQFAEPQTFSESDVFKSIVMGFFGM